MPLDLRVLTDGPSHFFGFHDLTPWNPSGQNLVCLRTTVPENRIPDAGDIADVVVLEETTGSIRKIGETRAWNWQQGSRQRWIGEHELTFNRHSPTGPVATIVDLNSGASRDLDSTLSDVSVEAQIGVTVDFSRLHRLYPAYGYAGQNASDIRPPGDDGLFQVDLRTGGIELLLSIKEVASATLGDVRPEADFFTHASLSPDARRVVFLYRRNHPSGAQSTNLVVIDLNDGSWKVLADDSVSHFDWEDEQTIIVWCRKNRAIGRLKRSRIVGVARFLYGISRRLTGKTMRRVIYGESFRRIDAVSGDSRPVGLGVLDEDGHPMINPQDSRIWVNDTYPDDQACQTLMLFNSERNQRLDLFRLPTPREIIDTAWRCDFHPRWDPTGIRICFDSAHLGRRQLCVVNVDAQLRELGDTRVDTARSISEST